MGKLHLSTQILNSKGRQKAKRIPTGSRLRNFITFTSIDCKYSKILSLEMPAGTQDYLVKAEPVKHSSQFS
jgi:hypothetical protein